jgi:chaperone BCS1
MFLIEIKDNNHLSILRYIYKNKSCLSSEQTLNCIVNRIRNDELDFAIGLGNYKFNFEDNIIEIVYKEEGKAKGTEMNVQYFKRLTVIGEDEVILKKFISKCLELDFNVCGESTDIYISNDCGDWIKYNKINSRNLNTIYLDDEIKTKIMNDLENFKSSENEYIQFGIPYKKTYLLTGAPGMGKSSLIKALCTKYNYSLSFLAVSKNFDNTSLVYAIRDLNENSILLLEDIDCLFDKRNVSQENSSLTFSNLINILDGVLYKHGIIIFMTTNHPEKLDNALMRIGRIDMIINIDYPKKEMIQKAYNDILKNISEDTKITFNTFYDYINNKRIPMCAIVNFLFRYKNDWEKHIDELVNTDYFIKKTLKQDTDKSLYV